MQDRANFNVNFKKGKEGKRKFRNFRITIFSRKVFPFITRLKQVPRFLRKQSLIQCNVKLSLVFKQV